MPTKEHRRQPHQGQHVETAALERGLQRLEPRAVLHARFHHRPENAAPEQEGRRRAENAGRRHQRRPQPRAVDRADEQRHECAGDHQHGRQRVAGADQQGAGQPLATHPLHEVRQPLLQEQEPRRDGEAHDGDEQEELPHDPASTPARRCYTTSAPPQEEPLPAVQAKQCDATAIGAASIESVPRSSRPARVSGTSSTSAADRSCTRLKSQS